MARDSNSWGWPDYPLRRWRLRNFKSVVDVGIELAPLTVIAGTNSSGKSSLIQSMLLAAQSARARSDGAVPLNGPLVQLGRFEHVHSAFAAPGEPIEIELELFFRRSTAPNDLTTRWVLGLAEGPPKEPGALMVSYAELTLAEGQARTEMRVSRTESVSDEDQAAYSLGQLVARHAGRYVIQYQGDVIRPEASAPPIQLYGVQFEGAIPRRFLIEGDSIRVFAQTWWQRLLELNAIAAVDTGSDETEELIRRLHALETRAQTTLTPERRRQVERDMQHVRARLTTLQSDRGTDAMSPEDKLDALVDEAAMTFQVAVESDVAIPADLLRPPRPEILSLLRDPEVRSDFEGFIERLAQKIGPSERVLVPPPEQLGEVFDDEALLIRDFLETRVRYLGPIRQAVGPFGGAMPMGVADDIGISGEFTASTLYSHWDRVVICPNPDGTIEQCTLGTAVQRWLRHFRVADTLQPVDLGAGVEIQIQPPGLDRRLDLGKVGVGVGQVLPVLVRCLMADPGCVVLLEQPELHLHPALEQQLGDFLLNCSRAGRQLIVETHSEHIISRLRRRVAEDLTGEVHELFRLVYTEMKDGRTRVRDVSTTELGGLSDWPEGFFDQGLRESRAILEAGLTKAEHLRSHDDAPVAESSQS
jgi:AAA domain, putative AbiEii toxin, Type IV TA system